VTLLRSPRPCARIPDIVEELLVMGYEESLVFEFEFENSPRWMKYIAGPYRQVPLVVSA
jgi:hypothetical protein